MFTTETTAFFRVGCAPPPARKAGATGISGEPFACGRTRSASSASARSRTTSTCRSSPATRRSRSPPSPASAACPSTASRPSGRRQEMYAAVPDLDAVAVCTPPQVRYATARACARRRQARHAGKAAGRDAERIARARRTSPTRAGAACSSPPGTRSTTPRSSPPRKALAGKTVRAMAVNWKEDVRRWHPGQKWIWTSGGFGVFDPGINALSIVTAHHADAGLRQDAPI